MKLSQLGEFGFIERLRRRTEARGDALGIGDDCAATRLPAGEKLLTTTDMLIEGVHFRRDWTDMRTLGRKCVAVNVSDIAAMGGTPRHLFFALGAPGDMTVEEIDALAEGVLEAADHYGAELLGGDTCRSGNGLVLCITAQGSVPETEMVKRSGAESGDIVCVSGCLGDSALALRQLLAGELPERQLADRHHDPKARTSLGRQLAQKKLATAMIDISDGLLADLGHIMKGSGSGARIERDSLPMSAPFRDALKREPDLIDLALGGGEDYELLFCVAPGRVDEVLSLGRQLGLAVTPVGEMVEGETLSVVDATGKEYAVKRAGFNHFARQADRD